MTRLVQATSSIIWVKCDFVMFGLETVAARDVYVPTNTARDVSVATVAARVGR